MDNTYVNILLAVAVIVVPLGLAGLLVEFHARQKSPPGNGRRHIADTD